MKKGDKIIAIHKIEKDSVEVLGQGTIIGFGIPPYDDKGENALYRSLNKKVPYIQIKKNDGTTKKMYGSECILYSEDLFNKTKPLFTKITYIQ